MTEIFLLSFAMWHYVHLFSMDFDHPVYKEEQYGRYFYFLKPTSINVAHGVYVLITMSVTCNGNN